MKKIMPWSTVYLLPLCLLLAFGLMSFQIEKEEEIIPLDKSDYESNARTSSSSSVIKMVIYEHADFRGKFYTATSAQDRPNMGSASIQLQAKMSSLVLAPHCTVQFFSSQDYQNPLEEFKAGDVAQYIPWLGEASDKARSFKLTCHNNNASHCGTLYQGGNFDTGRTYVPVFPSDLQVLLPKNITNMISSVRYNYTGPCLDFTLIAYGDGHAQRECKITGNVSNLSSTCGGFNDKTMAFKTN